MTNQQILEKAIQKAIDGGWRVPLLMQINQTRSGQYRSIDMQLAIRTKPFAKALWGERRTCLNCGASNFFSRETTCIGCLEPKPAPAWQYHLQQMVIAEDPIKYLGEHLDD